MTWMAPSALREAWASAEYGNLARINRGFPNTRLDPFGPRRGTVFVSDPLLRGARFLKLAPLINETLASQRLLTKARNWSGRRDSNSRPQPWQGCALPLSYARSRRRRRNSKLPPRRGKGGTIAFVRPFARPPRRPEGPRKGVLRALLCKTLAARANSGRDRNPLLWTDESHM